MSRYDVSILSFISNCITMDIIKYILYVQRIIFILYVPIKYFIYILIIVFKNVQMLYNVLINICSKRQEYRIFFNVFNGLQ